MSRNLSPSVSRLLAVSFLAAAVTGCATTPPGQHGECIEESQSSVIGIFTSSNWSYNQDCALDRTANYFSQSDDLGEQVMAQIIREDRDPRVKDAGNKVRDMAVTKELECPINKVTVANGRKIYTSNTCEAVKVTEKPAVSKPSVVPAP